MTLFQLWGFLGSDFWGWGQVLRYFHIYLGLEHYFWFKISEKSYSFGSMKICGYLFFFFFGGGGGSLRNRTMFFCFFVVVVFFFFGGGGGHFYIF